MIYKDEYYVFCNTRTERYIKYCCDICRTCGNCFISKYKFKELESYKALSLKLGKVLILANEQE